MKTVIFSCFLLAALVACVNSKSYQEFQVLSIKSNTEEQLALIWDLQRNNNELTFLNQPSESSNTFVAVPPKQMNELLDTLDKAGIAVTVQSTDLQAEIDAEMKENSENQIIPKGRSSFTMAHNVYYNLSKVNELMARFASSYPSVAKRRRMNHVTEGNRWPVYYMELGSLYDQNANKDKPVIIIEGLAHAREWISTASLIYVMHQMLNGYANDEAVMKTALTTFTWIIVPVLNPDGYDYTWTVDRFWRKNRKSFDGKECVGVDLNRNFDVHFGEVGVNFDCDAENYLGDSAFSESETRNVRDLFLELKTRVVAYLSVHSFSQLLLYPWAYATPADDFPKPSNHEKLVSVGEKMKEALNSQGKIYRLGTAYDVLEYVNSGAAEDWALQEKPGIYAYCYELRPKTIEEGHFMLHRSQIVPTGKELLQSLLVLAKCISEDRV